MWTYCSLSLLFLVVSFTKFPVYGATCSLSAFQGVGVVKVSRVSLALGWGVHQGVGLRHARIDALRFALEPLVSLLALTYIKTTVASRAVTYA